MKKLVPFVIIIISSYICQGQIVLTQADLPAIGDVQVWNRLDSTASSTVSPGTSGASQVWNFASLVPNSMDTITYLNPSATPNGASFPGANIANTSSSNPNRYTYYINGSTGMKIYGFDNPPATILDIGSFEFPLLAYGNSIAHAVRYRYNIINANTYDVGYLSQNSTADGWGTITTPAGTVNAIRIYTTETSYDSSYVGGVGKQNNVITGYYYYKWYAKNLGWPVLQIAKGRMAEPDFQTVQYAGNLSSASGIESLERNYGIKVFPNPFSSSTTLQTNNPLHNATLTVDNIFGQTVTQIKNISGQTITLHRDNLPSGLYFVRLTEENKTIAIDKLVISGK